MALPFFSKNPKKEKDGEKARADRNAAPEKTAPAGVQPMEGIPPPTPSPAPPRGFLERLKQGLSKTRQSLASGLDKIISGKRSINGDLFEALEELLITADVGVQTTLSLMEQISKQSYKISDSSRE